MAYITNIVGKNIFSRFFSFLRKPFYEQKYIILEKFLRIFCDWAFISSHTTLKMVTKKYFYKVGYISSPYVSREIHNIGEIRHIGFGKYMLPCRTFRLGPIGIIRYPRVVIDNPVTYSEAVDMLRSLSKLSKKTEIDIMDLVFVKDFLASRSWSSEEAEYLRNMKLSVLYGPIHGDFHSGNILRYDGGFRLIDFDMFEHSGIHHFDFLNQYCLVENFHSESNSWFDNFQHMLSHWNQLESHEYWSDLTSKERKDIFYLFAICKLNEVTHYHKSAASDERYRDVLKKIRNLPVCDLD